MRTRLLRGKEAVTVQLVYPSALDEYRQVLDVLGGCLPVAGNGGVASVSTGSKPGHAAYVVTTAQQRQLWGLPDLAVSGGAVPVDEESALELLRDAVVNPDRAVELFPAGSPVSGQDAGAPSGSWFDAVRDFLSVARFDEAVGALDGAGSRCTTYGGSTICWNWSCSRRRRRAVGTLNRFPLRRRGFSRSEVTRHG